MIESFLKKVHRMRGLQRELRKTRALTQKEKQELWRLEREVDEFTRNYTVSQHTNER